MGSKVGSSSAILIEWAERFSNDKIKKMAPDHFAEALSEGKKSAEVTGVCIKEAELTFLRNKVDAYVQFLFASVVQSIQKKIDEYTVRREIALLVNRNEILVHLEKNRIDLKNIQDEIVEFNELYENTGNYDYFNCSIDLSQKRQEGIVKYANEEKIALQIIQNRSVVYKKIERKVMKHVNREHHKYREINFYQHQMKWNKITEYLIKYEEIEKKNSEGIEKIDKFIKIEADFLRKINNKNLRSELYKGFYDKKFFKIINAFSDLEIIKRKIEKYRKKLIKLESHENCANRNTNKTTAKFQEQLTLDLQDTRNEIAKYQELEKAFLQNMQEDISIYLS